MATLSWRCAHHQTVIINIAHSLFSTEYPVSLYIHIIIVIANITLIKIFIWVVKFAIHLNTQIFNVIQEILRYICTGLCAGVVTNWVSVFTLWIIIKSSFMLWLGWDITTMNHLLLMILNSDAFALKWLSSWVLLWVHVPYWIKLTYT